jgi:acetylornithine deacetylase/succinyl-diaminopimelate desuccinylase-like protein
MLKISFLHFLFFLSLNSHAQNSTLNPDQSLARSIFKELIEINTTHATGNTSTAAEAMAKRFLAAGYAEKDIQIIGPEKRNRNLILHLHGSGKGRPVLFLAHLDVVAAIPSDWSLDPFKLTEQDGYFYGRGTLDIKDGAAILAADFIRLKKEGFIPDRDLILALTAGEESRDVYNGVEWLVTQHRPLIDAEYCINMDAGDPQLKNGKRIARTVQVSEKGVLNLKLEVKNPGGHGSLPSKNNAIYHLAKGLTNLAAYDFPVQLTDLTKSYFYAMSIFERERLASDMKSVADLAPDPAVIKNLSSFPYYNALMRNTCVCTMLDAGHAINALPQTAIARLNCRIMPGDSQDEVIRQLNSVLADSQIVLTVIDSLIHNPASEMNPSLQKMIEQVTAGLWPAVPVISVMDVGASDGIYLRAAGIPTFGISGVFMDVNDNRAHGKDERILVKSFYDGLEYEYALMKAVGRATE